MTRHPTDKGADTQFEAVRRLGAAVADGRLSVESAQMVFDFVVGVASENAPHANPQGLRVRLAWVMNDAHRHTLLARIRTDQTQKRELATLAEQLLRGGTPEQEVRNQMLEMARTFRPKPPAAILYDALALGQWRARNQPRG